MARRRMTPWLAMAVLVVLSLGATVFVAQRALTDASDIVVRGEGDVLLSTVAAELGTLESAPTNDDLARVRAEHDAAGLRYVAVIDRGGHPVAQAGDALVHEPPRPGTPTVEGARVRVAGPLFPPRRPPPPGEGFEHHRPMGPSLLVVELEPPVIAKLRGDLARVSIVAALAGAILLAFTIAWSRSAARLAGIEEKAAREQRLVALGSMSSVMAHELRNPLASLKGHAQLLAEDLEDGDAKKKAKADRVVREAERLEQLTSSLLDFVRDGPIERARIAPRALVERALDDLVKDRVKLDLDAAPEAIEVDEARLARALHNIVDNALQAAEGEVELRVARDGDTVVFEVRDHGPGIPPGSEAQIFEPFHTTRTRGTGLGLAVARRIAEQHGGTLTGENQEAGGALFRLRFPDAR